MSTAASHKAADALYLRRRITNGLALLLACATALFGLFFLGWILWTLLSKGLPGINLDLFTKMTPPPMQEGGLLNAFFGSAVMCALAIAIGTPLGVAAGTWLAEYGNARKAGTVVRFVNDILLSAPSIVLGLFVYTLYVMQTGGQFSAFKSALVDLAVAKLGPIGGEMKRLTQDPVYIDSVLADGSDRARAIAAETMKAVKDIVGFVRR